MESAEEKFNPYNPKYRSVEDLPTEERSKFKNVEGGFTREGAYNVEFALREAERILDLTRDHYGVRRPTKERLEEARAYIEQRNERELKREQATSFLNEKFTRYSEGYKKDFTIPKLQWDNFSHLLKVEVFNVLEGGDFSKEKEWVERVSVNGLGFDPRIPLIEKSAPPEMRKTVEDIINNSLFEHYVGGWGGRKLGAEETAQQIETDLFHRDHGFYVGTTFDGWHTADQHNRTIIYFNKYFTELITPRHELAEEDLYDPENALLMKFGTTEGFMQEPGHPDAIPKFLANVEGHKITHYNAVLGVILETPVSVVQEKGPGEVNQGKRWTSPTEKQEARDKGSVIIGPLDSKLIPLLSGPEERLEGNRVIKKLRNLLKHSPGPEIIQEAIESQIQQHGQTRIAMPITRITPDIITGIIEYDWNGVVKKVALPSKTGFKVYNHLFEEQSSSKEHLQLTRDQLIQQEYSSLVRQGEIFAIRDLLGRTHVGPEFKIEDVQAGYRALIQTGNPDKILSILEFAEMTGVAPQNELIQESFGILLRAGSVDRIIKLKNATHIEPIFSERDVQEGYMTTIMERESSYKGLMSLRKITQIEPSEETMRKGYQKLLETRPKAADLVQRLVRLTAGSNIRFNISEDEVHELYRKLLVEKALRQIVDLREMSGVSYPVWNSTDVQKAYKEFKNQKTGWDRGVEWLREITNIEPQE